MIRAFLCLRAPLAIALLALPGCGSTGPDAPTGDRGAAPAAKSSGPLTIAPVDGRIGDATVASDAVRLRELRVGRHRTSPDVLKQGVGAGAACPDIDLLPTADNLAAINAATMCLINGERIDAGLASLSVNDKLGQSSAVHTLDMIQNRYFAHVDKSGSDVVDRTRAVGYIPSNGAWTVGENLAWGTGTLATPRGIVKAWMESQGHRENILRPTFREAGLGTAIGNPQTADGQGATYTMNFGAVTAAEADETAPVASNPSPRTAQVKSVASRHSSARTLRARRARAAKHALAAHVRRARAAARAGR